MKFLEKYYKWFIAFVFAVAVIAVYKTFDNLSNITKAIGTVLGAFQPFVIGFVIAYLLNIPAKKIESLIAKAKNKHISGKARGLSILSVYVIGVIAVALILWALIPALYNNIMDLYRNFPSYMTHIQNTINNVEILKKIDLFGDKGLDLSNRIMSMFKSINWAQFGKYAQGVFGFTSQILNVFIAIISSIYMLLEKDKLYSGAKRLMGLIWKPATAGKVMEYARTVNEIFTNYLYSRLICCVVMAVVCSIVLSIMKVRYALILGIFIGAMDMIPYFGSIISCVVAILVTIITGGIWKAVWAGIVLLVLQQIDGNVLGPRIMGNSLEISPLLIILAVSVGGSLFGFIGMLISVPVVALINVIAGGYMRELEAKKEKKCEE